MAGERQSIAFGQLLAEPVRNGIFKEKKFHGRGTKIVNMGELFAHPRLRAVPMRRVELSESESDRFMLKEGDLLFARRSLVAEGAGKCSVVLEIDEPTTFESSIIRARPDRTKADSLFLYYFFNSTSGLHCLDTIRRQVAVAGITGTDLAKLQVAMPPLPEQRAIAHILGTLDDKIELNRRMSETLEAMARALFKSWFVDFDPVRAKAEGRDPGLPQPLADLFPARLVDSELGEIPEGWEVATLGDVVQQLRDQENPLSFPDAPYQHFSIPAFDDGQMARAEFGESIRSLKSRVTPGVILMSKLNPEIERVWMVDVTPGDRAVCSTEFLVLRARPPFTRAYVYCLARSPSLREQIAGLVTGTSKSHQRAQVESILNLAIVAPPSPIVGSFDRSADGFLKRSLACRRENLALSSLRDSLLPKLVSGELLVQDMVGVPV